MDSNKDIYISGGKLFISVVGDGSNSAIDYGTENGGICEVSGGTVIACGGSTMAEGFDSSSTQGFLMYNTSADAGTIVSLESAGGSVILSEEIPYSFSSVVLSTPEMAVGDTCTITIGETAEEILIDNSSNNSGFGGGEMFGPGGNRENMPPDFPANSDKLNNAPSELPTPPDNINNAPSELPTPPDKLNNAPSELPTPPDHLNNAPSELPESSDNQNPGDRKGGGQGGIIGVSVILLILGCAIVFVFKGK